MPQSACGDSRPRLSGRAELAFLSSKAIPNLECPLSKFSKISKPTSHAALESKPAELRSVDSRGRLSPHKPWHASGFLSAVRAKLAFLSREEIPNLESPLSRFSKIFKPTPHAALESKPAELRSADSRGRLSPHGCSHTNLAMPQAFYRRQLPHLQVDDQPHFVTFCTDHRWMLPVRVRSLVLESCLHGNGTKYDLRVAVVMPDHVHMIFTPLVHYEAMEVCSLAEIMDGVKGASAHKINKT